MLAGGDTVRIGELTFDVIHLRGHTPGSVALALDGPATGGVTQLFTGDCLFPGGVGKTWQPGDFEQLLDDVSTRVFDVYDDATVVYPGHGDDTTLGAERPQPRRVARTRLVSRGGSRQPRMGNRRLRANPHSACCMIDRTRLSICPTVA